MAAFFCSSNRRILPDIHRVSVTACSTPATLSILAVWAADGLDVIAKRDTNHAMKRAVDRSKYPSRFFLEASPD